MADTQTKEKRSWMMSRVKGKDTKPEMTVRKYLHAHGFRYRLHVKDLPGSPDIVLPMYRTVIFVHGCFWHRHNKCSKATTPGSRVEFWQEKFRQNIERDERNRKLLRKAGWQVLIVWQCEITPEKLQRISTALKQGMK